MLTTVVNIRQAEYDVYIGRPGKGQSGYFGNPFEEGSRFENIRRFAEYFHKRVDEDTVFRAKVLRLRGQRLGCFCKPKDCHGDIIAAWCNEQEKPTR